MMTKNFARSGIERVADNVPESVITQVTSVMKPLSLPSFWVLRKCTVPGFRVSWS